MGSPIRFSISGRSAETDAPTVEELRDQVGDYFDILQGVEEAISEDGAIEIDWRVTDAGRNSPLALELTPYARRHGMNIETRTKLVKQYTANGLALLRTNAERPSYFTDNVLEKSERLFRRVADRLKLTKIEFGDDLPTFEIDLVDARSAAANVIAVRRPKDKAYKEIGSIEGNLQRVERDGFGRALLYVKIRLDGETIKCIARGGAQSEMEHREIGEIWKNQRVRVLGTIYYKSLGRISQMECDAVHFLRAKGELPSADDIINENFTGGMKSEHYLEKLRNGEFS